MSKRNQMPGLRQKGGVWHIEKRCKYCESGWLRESTGTSSRTEAQEYLISRLAELKEAAQRKALGVHTFEEASLRYLNEVTDIPSAGTIAMHLDQLFPFIASYPLTQVHDGTLNRFIDHETARGLSPKSVNNALAVVSAVLNKAARVWRTETGTPWLTQAPPRLTRLKTAGRTAKPYPLAWAEQDALIKALPRHLADAALYAINTGCREQEVCQLRWDWEVKIPALNTSVFILPESLTKSNTERVVVLNSIAERVVDSRRGIDPHYVFTYRGKRLGKLHTSGWRRGWDKAGLPAETGIMKGVHNLRHTFGRRLRGAGVALETRKALLGHANGDITTHYSAAELGELREAAETITNRGATEAPTLTVIKRKREVSENCRKQKKG